MKRFPLLLIALVGAILLGLAVGLPRPARPPTSSENALPAATSSLPSLSLASSALAATGGQVAWNPRELVVTLSPGETQSVLATATISRLVPAATVQVDAALRPYVSSTPSQLHALPHGGVQNFQLSVTVPSSTPFQTVSGALALHLRDGDQPVSTTLPITLTIGRQLVTSTGLKLAYPSDWIVKTGDEGTTLSVPSPAPASPEDTFGKGVFFRIHVLGPPGDRRSVGPANPNMLPITQWFAQYASDPGEMGGADIETLQVAGRPAISVSIAEGSGVFTHIYVPNGVEIVEIVFGHDAGYPVYNTIVMTMTF
jgi:hypothetical protein